MQNWYSQNRPLRSNGVAVGSIVGTGAGVLVAIEARVVATASATGMVGVMFDDGMEQDVRITEISINKRTLMRSLYSFSEPIDFVSVLRKEEYE